MESVMDRDPVLLAAVMNDPSNVTARAAYADWIDENCEDTSSSDTIRDMRYSLCSDVSLEEMQSDYDWRHVFGEPDTGYSNNVDVAPPGDATVNSLPVSINDVKRIIYCVNGANDEAQWHGAFELNDGRFLFATGSCDYTGWDCQGGNSLEVSSTLENLIQYAIEPKCLEDMWTKC